MGLTVSPVAFGLRMHGRIAVHLAGGGLKDFCLHPLGKPQHVDGAHDAGLDSFRRIVLVMNRRCRAGQIVNFIHLQKNGLCQIMTDQLEIGFSRRCEILLLVPVKKLSRHRTS
jgi:hypothetical protein